MPRPTRHTNVNPAQFTRIYLAIIIIIGELVCARRSAQIFWLEMFAKFGQSLCADRLHVFDLLLAQLQIAKYVVFLTDRIANGMTLAADHAAEFIT